MRGLVQLALDFWGDPGLAGQVETAGSAQNAKAQSAPPPDLQGPHRPAQPLAQVLPLAQFAHPRANRQTRLRHAWVSYEFQRARRRTIGMVVGTDGLVVRAPKWVPLYEVELALQEKADWILRKLDEMRERQQRVEAARIVWREGATFPFLGEPVIVVLDPAHAYDAIGGGLKVGKVEVHLLDAVSAPHRVLNDGPRLTLHIGLPQHATSEQIRDVVQAWLMRQARRLFIERLDHFAPRLQVQWRKLSLSSAGTRWGSASVDGSIRLNWRLVHFRLPVIDYVVAHELSHLRVMDHSPRFWDTVQSVVPDYKALRGELRDETLPHG